MKLLNDLSCLYKIDSYYADLIQTLASLEMQGLKDSAEYSKQMKYLTLVREEEKTIIDEKFSDPNAIDMVLEAHEDSITGNFNYYDLAFSYNINELKEKRIYLMLLGKYIENVKPKEDYTPIIRISLELEFFEKFLKNCKNPEIKYRLAYIYPDIEEKLVGNNFNTENISFTNMYVSFLESNPIYQEVRKEFTKERFMEITLKIFRDNQKITCIDYYLNYLKVLVESVPSNELERFKEIIASFSSTFKPSEALFDRVNQVFDGIESKKLD